MADSPIFLLIWECLCFTLFWNIFSVGTEFWLTVIFLLAHRMYRSFLLASVLADKQSLISLSCWKLSVFFFFLPVFKISPLSFMFSSFTIICWGMDFFLFFLLWIYSAFWIQGLVAQFWKVLSPYVVLPLPHLPSFPYRASFSLLLVSWPPFIFFYFLSLQRWFLKIHILDG